MKIDELCRKAAEDWLSSGFSGTPEAAVSEYCRRLNAIISPEIERLQAVIEKHDLCHDLHGKVGHAEFEEGCRRESIKEHGFCLWASRIDELEQQVAELRRDAERYRKVRSLPWDRFTSGEDLDRFVDSII